MVQVYFQNCNGQLVRTFNLKPSQAHIVLQPNNRVDLSVGKPGANQKTDASSAQVVGFIDTQRPDLFPIILENIGSFHLDKPDVFSKDAAIEPDNSRPWFSSLAAVVVLSLVFVVVLRQVPQITPGIEEELKQHVVKIIQKTPKVEKMKEPTTTNLKTSESKVTPTKKTTSVQRMGALKVLGRLTKKSNSVGGLNLSAVQVSPGAGLGGNAGSGGVQTSLYGKGLLKAALGPGNNVVGAGGYGTKGEGGGADGYGEMSLIGSTGTASIPLGKEAIINGGLDQGTISAVIQKNMGQIRFCYEQGLQSDPKLMGRVAVNFVIGSSGQVKLAELNSSTLHSQTVESCILMRLKTWKFPNPEGGVDVKVSHSFMLRRLGAG